MAVASNNDSYASLLKEPFEVASLNHSVVGSSFAGSTIFSSCLQKFYACETDARDQIHSGGTGQVHGKHRLPCVTIFRLEVTRVRHEAFCNLGVAAYPSIVHPREKRRLEKRRAEHYQPLGLSHLNT
jgi:hypothetical protein